MLARQLKAFCFVCVCMLCVYVCVSVYSVRIIVYVHFNTFLCHTYSMDGQLEFYDAESSEFILMQSSEHGMATDLEWDPTGRYVVTSVSFWSQKVL